jgi:sigma-54 dependent transcriptional regulator, flagellar regulatory protein
MSATEHRPSGTSHAIRQIQRLIAQVAAHESSVLVLGESGTGKEVVARAIHEGSPRASRPFIAVNCGAIPAELLESELFGHEKGAFTGAVATRKGRFELAEGGTLFLDEIGDMSLPMQVKLLRVLQERMFERVGSATTYRCNVRIIAATHRNLEEAISRGNFREDLYYRLNVFPIEMPPLRARLDDLPQLVNELADWNVAAGRPRVQLSAGALQCLLQHRWPGNVRELGNLVERLSILCGGRVVSPADLPPRYRPADWQGDEEPAVSSLPLAAPAPEPMPEPAPPPAPLPVPVFDAEREALVGMSEREALLAPVEPVRRELNPAVLPALGIDLRAHIAGIEESLIRQALERSEGIVAQAARLLGLRRTTLVEKLRKYGLGGADETTED